MTNNTIEQTDTPAAEHPVTTKNREPRTQAAAIDYCKMGFSVVSVHYAKRDGFCSCGDSGCKAIGKHPYGNWKWQTEYKMREFGITQEWPRHPLCNVGIITGAISGIDVIDIDGEEGLHSLQEHLGLTLDEMPVTPMVKTPGGGYHLYYRHKNDLLIKTRSGVLGHIDIRSNGGMVVAPPSKHSNGGIYKWVEGRSLQDVPIGEFDFTRLFEKPAKGVSEPKAAAGEPSKAYWYIEALEGVDEGRRNDIATRLAGRYFHLGLHMEEIKLLLGGWNKQNRPPMDDSEMASIIRSIYKKDQPEAAISRQDLLDSISAILKMTLRQVHVIRSDDSSSTKIEMVFDEGTCNISNNDLHNPINFQREISAATNKVVKRLSKKTQPTHDQLIQDILNAAEVTRIDDTATEKGETLNIIRSHVRFMGIIPEVVDPKDVPERGTFRYGGKIWFDLHDLYSRANLSHRPQWSAKNLAVRLERVGIENRDFNGRRFCGVTYEKAGWKDNTEFDWDGHPVIRKTDPDLDGIQVSSQQQGSIA
jgi:hypothetical protein